MTACYSVILAERHKFCGDHIVVSLKLSEVSLLLGRGATSSIFLSHETTSAFIYVLILKTQYAKVLSIICWPGGRLCLFTLSKAAPRNSVAQQGDFKIMHVEELYFEALHQSFLCN